jgi:hypothetical protein
MVYVEESDGTHYRHDTPDSAETEAKRLTRLNPDKNVYVLGAVRCFKLADVEDVEFEIDENPDGVPF